jgi:SAM-dependent methyltransferase
MMSDDLKERVLEPELMDDEEQARAYAGADFEEPHARIIELFDEEFPEISGNILDLGCGPGDVTLRFAKRFPETRIIGVDGSAAMIELAERAKERKGGAAEGVTFIRGVIPGPDVPRKPYSLIISTSFLHHLRDPGLLWETVKEYASAGTMVFVADLFRPGSRAEARRLVELYASGEPEILKKDFYNSLLAAFSPGEVEVQLSKAGLTGFTVRPVSDRHMIISGRMV